MRRYELGENKVRGTLPMVHPNAAAIDVGARMHVAAVGADRAAEPVRSFGTFTTDLHRLVDWFAECGVETVVMESTKAVPVRMDATWLAQSLLRHCRA
jgi:transposase